MMMAHHRMEKCNVKLKLYFFCIHLKICYVTCALDEVSKFSGVYEKVVELHCGMAMEKYPLEDFDLSLCR